MMFRPLTVFNALLALALCVAARGADLADAVVQVYAGNAAGSGTLIRADGDSGWVLTAAHVVRGGAAFRVVWRDGHVSGATLLGADDAYDLALLEIIPPPAAMTLPLAQGDLWPPSGESVELIGYGGGRLRKWTAKVNGYALTPGTGRHQTLSVATQTIGGDSGGAIVYRGRLVGVIWGGPLAGPRGPMLATHGTCCVAIRQFIEGLTPTNIRGAIASGCPNGQCPIAPRYPPPRVSPPIKPPAPPSLDYDQLADEIIHRIARDPRFRGPPGKDGPPGRDGRPGQDASEMDIDRLAEQVKQRLSGSIRIRVEPVGKTPANTEH